MAEWEFGSNDFGGFIRCSKCNHKISSVDVIFADTSINTCPFCNTEIEISDEVMEKVYSSLNTNCD